jgi:hypothetical protein
MRTKRIQLLLSLWFVVGAAALAPTAGATCGYGSLFVGHTIDATWSAEDCNSGASQGNRAYDYYLFSGAAGQEATALLTYTNPALTPVSVAIQSLDGAVLASGSGASPVSATLTLPASGYYVILVQSVTPFGYGDYTLGLAASSGAGACGSGMCLNAGRFQVMASWRKADGTSGAAVPALFTNDTGYFWFFNDSNVELVVKVLDARGVNGQFWVFASGLTNVGVDITVVDTETGSVKTYQNPLGTAFQPIQDTTGFPPPVENVNVEGVWDGITSGANRFVLALSQTGTSVTGTITTPGDPAQDLTGSVLGRDFTFTTNFPPRLCGDTITISCVVDDTGSHMTGFYSGANCQGPVSGTLTATRR